MLTERTKCLTVGETIQRSRSYGMRLIRDSLIASIVFSGCSSVTSTSQLGTPVSAEVAKEFRGVWLNSDGEPWWVEHVKGNELRFASVGWKRSEYRLIQFAAFVTEDEDQRYVNVTDPQDKGKKPKFEILRKRSGK